MLNRNFRLYIPGTNGGVLDPVAQRRNADEVMDDFAVMFGGATIHQAVGAWKAGSRLVKEPVTIVESFTDEFTYDLHRDDVHGLAAVVASRMGQDCVALEDCGVMHLVSPIKVEAAEAAA